MDLLFAHAIPTLDPTLRGIHLMWTGPAPFLYAPGGWTLERRLSSDSFIGRETCAEIWGASLQRLRNRLEQRFTFAWIRLTKSFWVAPEPGPCEVFTIDLDTPSTNVSGRYRGRHGFAIGLYRGKAVAYQFLPLARDGRNFNFGPAPIDRVVVYGLDADAVRCCVSDSAWQGGTVVAKLQLPLREFMPSLPNDTAELQEAERRLAPGESIDPVRFKDLADILRVAMRGPGRRPIDSLLRTKTESDTPEEMFALDPLRTLVASPKWRRVMGLGYLDRDPALTPNASYDYRISGLFPANEQTSRVYGFHTIPPGTLLPAMFSLADVRILLPQPITVNTAPGIAPSGAQWTTRNGIPLAPRNSLPWANFGIDDFSISIEFATPTDHVTLELDKVHDLKFAAGHPGGIVTQQGTVPAGQNPKLSFTSPITQLNLSGKGFLFAIRINASDDETLTPQSVILAGVRFQETPLIAAPLNLTVANLQAANALTTSAQQIRALHALGILARWQPAPAAGLPFWPTDLGVPSPLDATMFQLERRVEPSGPFEPVLAGEDNAMFGSRDEPAPDRAIAPGVDLIELYPEEPPPQRGSEFFHYQDVFRAPTEDDPAHRDAPPPGSVLRYRIRTVDVIGRPSPDWRESDTVRLEKHEAPPPPAAYNPTPADQFTSPGPTGVYARVLVKGAQDLTPAETALLGSSDNAILLRWGWHAAERRQDSFTTQFRVYLSPIFDVIPGEITSVTADATPGDWSLELTLAKAIAPGAAQGLALSAGYPFLIVDHSAGTTIKMSVRTRVPDSSGTFRKPALGPVAVPLKLQPVLTRPRSWSERFTTIPVTPSQQYEAVIRDRLLLSPEHPKDAIWVGVSAADSQFYVDDTFPTPGPAGPLPGNESAIVAILTEGKRAFRPEFTPPPPAGPVPRILTPEPQNVPIQFQLDPAPFLTTAGLTAGELVQPERTSVTQLFTALAVTENQLVALVVNRRDPSETNHPLTLPNPNDQAAAIAAVNGGSSDALEDRLAVALAARHPYADRFFQSATANAVPFAPFDQTLPPTEERYLYRVRRADIIQRLSAQAALVNAIVRVPSLAMGPSPQRAPSQANDPSSRLRVRIPLDPRLTHLLVFEHPVINGPAGEAALMRVPNRAELGPGAAIRLRLADGSVIAPAVEPLGAATDAQGWLRAVNATGPAGKALVWVCTLTADGIPSSAGGPWRLRIPKPPLARPVLSVNATATQLHFTWTLPDPLITSSWLEVSTDGVVFEPVSSILKSPAAEATVARNAAQRPFQAVGRSQDGRLAISESLDA